MNELQNDQGKVEKRRVSHQSYLVEVMFNFFLLTP